MHLVIIEEQNLIQSFPDSDKNISYFVTINLISG